MAGKCHQPWTLAKPLASNTDIWTRLGWVRLGLTAPQRLTTGQRVSETMAKPGHQQLDCGSTAIDPLVDLLVASGGQGIGKALGGYLTILLC